MSRSLTLCYSRYGHTEALAFLSVDDASGTSQVGLKRIPETAAEPRPRGEFTRYSVDAPVAALAEPSHQAIVYIGTDDSVPCMADGFGITVDSSGQLWLAGTSGGRQVVARAAAARQKHESSALLLLLLINLLGFGLRLSQQLADPSALEVSAGTALAPMAPRQLRARRLSRSHAAGQPRAAVAPRPPAELRPRDRLGARGVAARAPDRLGRLGRDDGAASAGALLRGQPWRPCFCSQRAGRL